MVATVPTVPHPIDMTATTFLTSHEELQRQYGVALRVWSEARGTYAANSPEVLAATALVDELEQKLNEHLVVLHPAKQAA